MRSSASIPKKKKLTIDGHPGETYDKLVIATGALQLRPDIPGILGENIFTIRDLSSVGQIKDYFYGTGAKKVVILGGGDIGVEAAEAFAQMGAEVFLLEVERMFCRVLMPILPQSYKTA